MLRKKTRVCNARFRHNQMMHSCKFYSFLRDQSLEKWVKYINILIINKRFYLLTEIFRQPTKIEKFNRLPTKIENFNWLPTKLLNFNRQPTSGPPPSDPLLTTFQQNYKQLLDEVFVISEIIKVEVSVISWAEGRGW